MRFHFFTLNIHKGYSVFNQRYILSELRDALRGIDADLVFLQEVHGQSHHREAHGEASPNQWEYLADEVWKEYAYAQNAIVEDAHHGNAILSKWPIERFQHHRLPSHKLEQRGYLEAVVRLNESKPPLYLANVHLGLLGVHRRKQIQCIHENCDIESPSILAGDFNDWTKSVHSQLKNWGWSEAHHDFSGKLARTFPSVLPLLSLDRVYAKKLKVCESKVLQGKPWSKLSDHLPLLVEFEIL